MNQLLGIMDYDKPINKGIEYPELTSEVFGINSLDQIGPLHTDESSAVSFPIQGQVFQENNPLPDYFFKTEELSREVIEERYGIQFIEEADLSNQPGLRAQMEAAKARQIGSSLNQKDLLTFLQSQIFAGTTAEEPQGQSELPLLSVYLKNLPRSIQAFIFVDPDKLYPAEAFGIHGKVKAKVMGSDLAPHHITYIINDAIAKIEEEEGRSPERSRQIVAEIKAEEILSIPPFKWEEFNQGPSAPVFPYGQGGLIQGVDPAFNQNLQSPSLPGINGTTFELQLNSKSFGIDPIL